MKAHLPLKGGRGICWYRKPSTYLALRDTKDPTNGQHDSGALSAHSTGTIPSKRKHPYLSEPPRIALYSHDAMGLGHMRRNLLIAQTLADSALRANVLMVAGAGEATAFGLPRGVDCLTLPALHKDSRGHYHARNLNLNIDSILELRSLTIRAALDAFQPDLFVVDKLPRGLLGELDLSLAHLCENGRTKCVLGLRDVLDEPEAVRRDWRKEASEEAICKYFSQIWVYGDPRVYDSAKEYHLSAGIEKKIRYTGYLDQKQRLYDIANNSDPRSVLGLPPGRIQLCLVGGGQDGARLAEAFSLASLPEDAVGVIVTGPYMPTDAIERLQQRASHNPHLRVLRFVPEPAILVSHADRIVAMGGYNTTCEILSFRKPALLVPRVKPRLEQWIRASRMADLDLLNVLHPDDLTSDAITDWLHSPRPTAQESLDQLDLDGLARLPEMAEELIASIRTSKHQQMEASYGPY